MRRAMLAGLALGAVAGLLVVYHDALRLTVAWPVVLGFALWQAVGRRGVRGATVAVAAAVGVAMGYVSYAVVAEYLPITNLWLGISIGTAVGLMALVGAAARERFPMSAMLLGFAAFAGIFEPLWAESPAAVRTHGIETLTVAALAMLVGILVATAVRAAGDGAESLPEAEAGRGERGEDARSHGYAGGAS